MAKFEKGDKVVRNTSHKTAAWVAACKDAGVPWDGVFLVHECNHTLSVTGLQGSDCDYWHPNNFRLATGLEIHQESALPAEDHIVEKESHIECLRNLLDVEREQVASLKDELAKCCGTVADKGFLQTRVEELNHVVASASGEIERLNSALTAAHCTLSNLTQKLTEVEDQRDAAVLAAKSLGDEVQGLRHDRRALRLNFTQCAGYVQALAAGVEDVDLEHLYNQLHAIGVACDEQGNGADAKLVHDASLVVEMVKHTLDEHLRFLEE